MGFITTNEDETDTEAAEIPTSDGVNCEQRRSGAATFEVLTASGAAFVVVTGAVGRYECADLLATVDDLLRQGARRVVIDLSCVTPTDAAGRDLVAQLAARRPEGVTFTGGGTTRLLSALGRRRGRRRPEDPSPVRRVA